MRGTVPVGWLNLVEDSRRFSTSVLGVAFAVVLMFVELGFLNGLNDNQSHLLQRFDADLIIVNANKEAVLPKRPFPRVRLIQARGVAGVASASPVYVEEYRGFWKNSTDGREYPIQVTAFNPDDPVFLDTGLSRAVRQLNRKDTALIDARSNDYYGPMRAGAAGELNGRAIRVTGTFSLGADLRVDGNLFVSDRTFFKCFNDPVTGRGEERRVEFGLIRLAEGADLPSVRDALHGVLAEDVAVFTKQEYIDKNNRFWNETKAIGSVFGIGTAVGFLIGIMICYQILYAGIVDRLPQYATLKAIGYSNLFLFRVVLAEAVYLSAFGFAAGLVLSLGAYVLLEQVTGLDMRLTASRALPVFLLTLTMCVISGLIASGKALRSDPVDLF